MAFPSITTPTLTQFASVVTSMSVNLPTSISSGDLLLAAVEVRNAGTWTPPSGWTELAAQEGGSSVGKLTLFYRIADGTESSTATWTAGTGSSAVWYTYKVTSWDGSTAPEAATANGDFTTQPNSPSLTPSWGSADTLWLSIAANTAGASLATGAPTNYTDYNDDSASAGGAQCNIASAYRQYTAASEDPGVFANGGSIRYWAAATIAVKPAGSSNAAPAVALNSPADSATAVSNPPQLTFTGTDADSDDVTYQLQLDTVNTFDSGDISIEFVGKSEAEANTITIPTHVADDLIVIFAARNGSTTAPTVPAGFTSAGINAGTNCSVVVAYKVAASSSETSGTWTNADLLLCHVYRNADSITRHAGSNSGATADTQVEFPSITTMNSATTSWGLRFAYISTTNTSLQTPPSSFSARSNKVGTTTGEVAGYDTNGTVSAVGYDTYDVGGTAGDWVTQTIEINKVAGGGSGPLIDVLSDTDRGFTDVTNGADTDPFASGDQIRYDVESLLTSGTTYYWRVRAKDPSGSNTFGDWATTRSFTTASGLTSSISDSVSVSESIGLDIPINATTSDSISVAENVSVIVESLNPDLEVNVSDNISISESISNNIEANLIVSDSIAVSESVKLERESHISVSDSIAVAEAVSLEVSTDVSASDTIAVAESVSASVEDAATLSISVSDSIGVSENTSLEMESQVVARDSIAVDESIALATEALEISVSDSISITENSIVTPPSALLAPSVVDYVGVAESVTLVIPELFTEVSDSIAVSEAISVEPQIEVSVSDSVSVSENLEETLTSDIAVSDSVTVDESLSLEESIEVITQDLVTVQESVSAQSTTPTLSTSDSVSVSENISVFIPELTINVSDSISVNENVGTQFEDYEIVVSDQISVSENTQAFTNILYINVSDNISVDEQITFASEYNKNAPLYYDIGGGLSMMLGARRAPNWGTNGRPSNPAPFEWGFNDELSRFEVWDGVQWQVFSPSTGRTATLTVAASDALEGSRGQADYVCDGVADDVQIQAAFNALPASGGTVELTEGTYYISSTISLPAKPFVLRGRGTGATYVKLVSGVNANMFEYTTATDVTFIKIEGMTLNGSKAIQTQGSGIYINPGNGSNHVWDARFQDLFILSFHDQGFYTNDAHHYVFDHVLVEYCGQSSAPWLAAIQLAGGDLPYMTNSLIKLNDARGMSCGAYGLSVTNTVFSQNGAVGLMLYADDCTVTGCKFDNNSFLATNTYPQLQISNDRCIINGNAFFGSDSRPKYSILLDASAENNVIANNTFNGYTTAAVSDGGSATTYKNNLGWPDSKISLGEKSLELDSVLSSDETWSGITTAGISGATLAVGDVCYLESSGKWVPVDGILDGTDTGFDKQLGICLLASTDTNPTEILLYGKVRSAAFPAFTAGSPVYLSDTAGELTTTQPSTTNFVIRVVGYALTSEDLMFNPSNDYVVHT